MKVALFIYFLLALGVLLNYAECARILGVFPLAGKSVNILYNKLMKGLADAGHDVTVVSAYKNKLSIVNGSYTDVVLTGFAEDYDKLLQKEDFLNAPQTYSLFSSNHFMDMFLTINNATLHHPNVKPLLNPKDEKFDLVITEHLLVDLMFIFSHIYDCPLVLFTSVGGANPWVNDVVGNPLPPSYVPHFCVLARTSEELPFFKRLENFWFYLNDFIIKQTYRPIQNSILRSVYPSAPDIFTLQERVDLVLLGGHPSIRQAMPILPNMVEIGGFHIEPPKKLPNDLQKFMDDSKDGVIFFSMGSHINSKDFSLEKKKVVLNVFRKLKQRIIWKFEDEDLPGKPDNLLIRKWLPQMDILAHPNLKLFISHGGHGSTLEAVYHGVPTLMIPIFADQHTNAQQAVDNGFALQISYSDSNFNENTFSSLINELIHNPKYSEAAKFRSRLFHDRPMKPLDAAVYWVEYVLRHKGASHLKVAGRNLPWYKFFMVDVIALLVFIVVSILFISYSVVKLICRSFLQKTKVKQS